MSIKSIGGPDVFTVNGWDYPVAEGDVIQTDYQRRMNQLELDALMAYMRETSENGVHVKGSCNPSRLETHALPDGSEVVALFDTHGDVWRVYHLVPVPVQ